MEQKRAVSLAAWMVVKMVAWKAVMRAAYLVCHWAVWLDASMAEHLD